MKVMILGAGAMGSLYGGLLKEAGNQVTLVDVSKEHIEAINENGLILETDDGKKAISIEAKYASQGCEVPDLIIIFTKTIHSQSALESIKDYIGSNTTVLTLQNGLGNDEKVEAFLPKERIVVGTTNFPSDLVKPGYVSSFGKGVTKIMSCSGEVTEELKAIEKILNDAGLNCEITEDVFVSIWEKVAFNAACNTLTAVTRLRLGDMGQTVEGKELAYAIAKEVVKVANIKDIKARENIVLETLDTVFVGHADHMPSMMQDVLGNRITEIDSINGAVVREAEKLGVSVPVTKVLYQLICIIQNSYTKIVK